MDIHAELQREHALLESIQRVAKQEPSLGFADLQWETNEDIKARLARLRDGTNPGVKFITLRRILVMEHWGGLRYYAGGWASSQENIHAEQERIYAEGSELGEFPDIADALRFADLFLVQELALQIIDTPRNVHWWEPTEDHPS